MDRSTSQCPERQTTRVVMKMNRYGIDVAAINETRLPGYDSMEDRGCAFFWSGKSANERRDAEIGFALKKGISATLDKEPSPVSDRLMSMRLFLQKESCATFICVYASTVTNSEKVKEQLYSDLRETIN